jgi:hypothetical protein
MTYRAFRFTTALLASTAFLSLAALKPATTGYAESAEGLRVYYEVYGQGERNNNQSAEGEE